jgi:hypothetical protein
MLMSNNKAQMTKNFRNEILSYEFCHLSLDGVNL